MRARLACVLLVLLVCGTASWAQDPERGPSGWMGVMLAAAPNVANGEGAEASEGALVTAIVLDSPADRAGLRARDRILTVDGSSVESVAELIARVKALDPGSWIAIEIERRGERRELRIRLGERPTDAGEFRLRQGWIGIEAIDLPPALRLHFGAPEEAGAMVSSIEPTSPAEVAGFELGDVVYEVDGEPVGSARELANAIRRGGVGNPRSFTLVRDGAEIELETTLENEPEEPVDPAAERSGS